MNSLAGRVAVKYRDVFYTTQAAVKIVPALQAVTEKAPLMSMDGQAAIAILATPHSGILAHHMPVRQGGGRQSAWPTSM